MTYFIKIIFFQLFLILIFTANLSSAPIIILELEEGDTFNVKEFPSLVLQEIESQFSNLDIDQENFIIDSEWLKLREWKDESSEIFILNIKNSKVSSDLEEFDLILYLYQYELRSHLGVIFRNAINFINSNPRVPPLVLKFSLNIGKDDNYSERQGKIKEILKTFEASQNKKQKDPRQGEMKYTEKNVKICKNIWDKLSLDINKASSILSIDTELLYPKFKGKLEKVAKTVDGNLLKLNQCTVGIYEHEERTKAYEFSSSKDPFPKYLRILRDKVLSDINSLKEIMSEEVQFYSGFRFRITSLLGRLEEHLGFENDIYNSQRNSTKISKEIMMTLKTENQELFTHLIYIPREEKRKSLKVGKRRVSSSSTESIDTISLDTKETDWGRQDELKEKLRIFKASQNKKQKNHNKEPKDRRKLEMEYTQKHVKICKETWNKINLNINKASSILSIDTELLYPKFKGKLEKVAKTLDSDLLKLNKCTVGLNNHEDRTKKYEVSSSSNNPLEEYLTILQENVLSEIESLKNHISEEVEFYSRFNFHIYTLLDRLHKHLKFSYGSKRDFIKVDQNIMMTLKTENQELFTHLIYIPREEKRKSLKVEKRRLSESIDLIDLDTKESTSLVPIIRSSFHKLRDSL